MSIHTKLPAATVKSRVSACLEEKTRELHELELKAKNENFTVPADLNDKEMAYREMLKAMFTAKYEETLSEVKHQTLPNEQIRAALRKELEKAHRNNIEKVEESVEMPQPITSSAARAHWLTTEHAAPELVQDIQSLSACSYRLVELSKLMKTEVDVTNLMGVVNMIEDVYQETSLGQWAQVMRDYLVMEKENFSVVDSPTIAPAV